MRRHRNNSWWTCVAVIIVLATRNSLHGDDPLRAMPTAKDSVENKVARLTPMQRKTLAIPIDKDLVVCSIEFVETESEAERNPWLTVYADGSIVAGAINLTMSKKRTGKINEAELLWLLHLAVNECDGLRQDTAAIKSNHAANSGSTDGRYSFNYHLHLRGNENSFTIPNEVLVLRPMRAKMKLTSFASLNRFAKFLVDRTFLGSPEEREAILDLINEQLISEFPDCPSFRIEHVVSVAMTDKVRLSATFQQEIPLGDDRSQIVTGTLIHLASSKEPDVTVQSRQIRKHKSGRSRERRRRKRGAKPI